MAGEGEQSRHLKVEASFSIVNPILILCRSPIIDINQLSFMASLLAGLVTSSKTCTSCPFQNPLCRQLLALASQNQLSCFHLISTSCHILKKDCVKGIVLLLLLSISRWGSPQYAPHCFIPRRQMQVHQESIRNGKDHICFVDGSYIYIEPRE